MAGPWLLNSVNIGILAWNQGDNRGSGGVDVILGALLCVSRNFGKIPPSVSLLSWNFLLWNTK